MIYIPQLLWWYIIINCIHEIILNKVTIFRKYMPIIGNTNDSQNNYLKFLESGPCGPEFIWHFGT